MATYVPTTIHKYGTATSTATMNPSTLSLGTYPSGDGTIGISLAYKEFNGYGKFMKHMDYFVNEVITSMKTLCKANKDLANFLQEQLHDGMNGEVLEISEAIEMKKVSEDYLQKMIQGINNGVLKPIQKEKLKDEEMKQLFQERQKLNELENLGVGDKSNSSRSHQLTEQLLQQLSAKNHERAITVSHGILTYIDMQYRFFHSTSHLYTNMTDCVAPLMKKLNTLQIASQRTQSPTPSRIQPHSAPASSPLRRSFETDHNGAMSPLAPPPQANQKARVRRSGSSPVFVNTNNLTYPRVGKFNLQSEVDDLIGLNSVETRSPESELGEAPLQPTKDPFADLVREPKKERSPSIFDELDSLGTPPPSPSLTSNSPPTFKQPRPFSSPPSFPPNFDSFDPFGEASSAFSKVKPRTPPTPTSPTSSSNPLARIVGHTTVEEKLENLRNMEAEKQMEREARIAYDDTITHKVEAWAGGKKGNLRALLSNLQAVLWEDSNWKPVPLGELVIPQKLKLTYMKALRIVHPDKMQNENIERKLLAERIFDLLQQAQKNEQNM